QGRLHGFFHGDADGGLDRIGDGIVEVFAEAVEHAVEAIDLFAEARAFAAIRVGHGHRGHGNVFLIEGWMGLKSKVLQACSVNWIGSLGMSPASSLCARAASTAHPRHCLGLM